MSERKKVIAFLCTDHVGAEEQIAELSDMIVEHDLHVLVVTDHSDTTVMLERSRLISARDNVIFLGNNDIFFETHSDAVRCEEIVQEFQRDDSYLNIFSVDYDRFSYLGLSIPTANNLRITFVKFIYMFQCLHSYYDVVVAFSEGPHNFFLRAYDVFRSSAAGIGRYIYLRPGRVGNSLYLQDADSNETVVVDSVIAKDGVDKSLFYMRKEAPLMRSLFWKLKNFSDTSAFRTISKIWITKSLKIGTFDRSNIISLMLSLWMREVRSVYITLTGRTRRLLTDNLPMEKVVVYPEHYHPEASTSAYDFGLCNDYENAIRIRKSIPEQYTLVYKLHPSNKNRHPAGLMKRLGELPGVLITEKPLSSVYKKDNLILLSISSTMIFDFVENQRPVIIIGNPEFYSDVSLRDCVVKTSLENFELNSRELIEQAKIKASSAKPFRSRENLLGPLYTPKSDLKLVILSILQEHESF